MNEQASKTSGPEPLESAFTTLRTYDPGSPRGDLCPIDDAIAGALNDPKARAELERRLVALLKEKPSAPATEYICSKLNLIGSATCVPALAELLKDHAACTTARNVLEKIHGDAPDKALRKALSQLAGAERIGVIRSLGARRDTGSVATLAGCLRESSPQAAAAATALGEIGTVKAAKALKSYLVSGSGPVQKAAADSALVCAEHLAAEGHTREAKSLYGALLAPGFPAHIQQASARGLAECQRPGT